MLGFKKNHPKGTTAILIITGMHCVSCSMSIDGELEDMPGVYSSETNYAKAKTVVEYDSGSVTLDALLRAIQQLGYDAQPES